MSTNVKRVSFLFVILAALFCVSLIVSNIIAGKLTDGPFGLVLTAGIWLFPIVYIIGDVVPEVYGLKMARKMIWLGFGVNLFAVFFFWLTLQLKAPVFWTNQEAFNIVLGFTPRLLLASFVGYLIGTNANALVLVWMKKLTRGRWLWTRTIGSTIIGETLDTICFVLIAFAGVVPWNAIPMMIIGQASFKIVYEAVATPLTYLVVHLVKKQEKLQAGFAIEG